MTKTLKDLFEVYKPKSPDEQKFVDKHVTIKHKDRNGNGDDVFNGNTKYIKRKEERHGYDVGDDEKVYEEVEEVEEKKLTPAEMKKREEVAKAIERENPKMPMAKKMAIATATAKKVAEEAIDELSVVGLDKYHSKAYQSLFDKKSDEKTVAKRKKGMDMAYDKAVSGKAKVMASEEAELEEGSYKDGETRMGSVGPITTDAERAERAKKFREKKMAKEEAEQVDEVSAATLRSYTDKASDARGHRNLPTAKVDNRYKGVAMAHKKIAGRNVTAPTNEESEQIDELSKKTLGSYVKKASGAEQPKNVMSPKNVPLTKIAAYQGDSETGYFGKRFNQHTYDKAERLRKNRETGIKRAVDKITKEDVEQVDEISKAMAGRYVKKAAASIDLTAWRQGHKEAGAGNPSKQLEKKLSKRHKGIEAAVSKLTKEEVIKRAIDKYMPELEDYVPMTQEEKLVGKLEHLPEAHVLMLLGLYENLNEDNRSKMMSAVDTPEGINGLIDFAIQNRGE